jgi:hypothetical protein
MAIRGIASGIDLDQYAIKKGPAEAHLALDFIHGKGTWHELII